MWTTRSDKLDLKYYPNIQSLNAHFGTDCHHPLIDIHPFDSSKFEKAIESGPASYDFYKISFVENAYELVGDDNVGGALFFTPPGQSYDCSADEPWQGYQVLVHPDIYKSHLVEKNISAYRFFEYNNDTPLLLSKSEAARILFVLDEAHRELQESDQFSVSIILSYVSILLNSCERLSLKKNEPKDLQRNDLSEALIKELRIHFSDANPKENRPKASVAYFAKQLNVTPNHLSDMVREAKGVSALQIIHEHIIEEARLMLASSSHSVSEISYQLGFDYPSYFSRLFKKKTKLSPSEFRQSVKSI